MAKEKYYISTAIAYTSAKPHIGTDNLVNIVRNMREYIISKGGTFLFDTKVTQLEIQDNKITAIYTEDNKKQAPVIDKMAGACF